ncbi:carboxypeptidase regulatory-like domain-containing protein [Pseudomonas sp. CCM 7893]|uniref:Carboxypeptidase regulatory-like domain-containing protein n=1 Tax=Pseudomonas spelaei TaxID=1055469 RepID=A0A6I3WIS7_9PSED|nr:carboxypeptidase regulatory-like domain-containing protein [Pseudomonas spelaei]MUF07193.1 carboxypeptidase regulatory-like domain-containing protein [Pseudomonas spelaei]QLG93478.1 carboxypeptidase regulatory-like domain-containing protein [Pseudomonas yamanorum]
MKSLRLLAFSGAALVVLSGFPAMVSHASSSEPIDTSAVQLEQQQQNGIAYLSGGIGLDESRAIQQAKGYTLHLTFSTGPGNEYVPDVDIAIQNMQGHSLLTLNQVGPIVYVQLAPGRYVIVGTRNGHEHRSVVELKGGAVQDLNLHWSDAT